MAMPIVSVTSESVDRANAKLVGNVMCEEMVIAATDSPSETITKGMTVQQDVMEERHTSLSPTYAPSSPAACCMTPETRAPAAPNASKWKRAVTLEGKHKDRVYEWHEETRATRWYEVKQWRLVTTSAGTYEFHCETQETRWLRDEEGPRPTACEFGEHVPIPVDWQKQ